MLQRKGTVLVIGRAKMVGAIKKVLREMKCREVEFVFVEALFSECLEEVDQLVKKVDAFLAGRYHSELLRSTFPTVPIVTLEPSGFDIISAILEASKEGDEIVHLVNSVPLRELDTIKTSLRVGIEQVLFDSVPTLRQVLETISASGYRTVVGGSLVCDTALEYGLKPYFHFSEKTVKGAVCNAARLVANAFERRVECERLKAVVDLSGVGLLVTNCSYMIEYASDLAARILGYPSDTLLGSSVYRILPKDFLESNHAENVLLTIKGEKMVCTRLLTSNGYVIRLQEAKSIETSESEIRRQAHRKIQKAKYTFRDIIGTGLREVIEVAKCYAKESEAPILIVGPTGSGKELLASAIHNYSSRASGPFVAINCAALPPTLLESELFGYEEGAFTGAKRSGKRGLIDLAHNGTLFLDEIGEFPISLQSKLLRVLEEKEILPIGGEAPKPVNVRIIAATNRDLRKALENETFRRDLYYRIATLELTLPPLSERKEDIPALVDRFVGDRLKPVACEAVKIAIMRTFENWPWPGNVRELQNVVERAIVYLKSEDVAADTLSCQELVSNIAEFFARSCMSLAAKTGNDNAHDRKKQCLKLSIETVEKALSQTNGNMSKAAKLLGVSRSTLWRKMKTYGKYSGMYS